MLRAFLGIVACVGVGAIAGQAVGGFWPGALGALLGMLAWLAWTLTAEGGRQPDTGERVDRDRKELLCIPKGQLAVCEFTRNRVTGEYLDVVCCSLLPGQAEVACAKKCLMLMNDIYRREPLAGAG